MADKQEPDAVAEGTAEVKGPENTAADETPQNIETACAENNITEDDKSQQNPAKDKTKIDILLKATGNAPIMKKKKWAVGQDYAIWRISDFIRKYLKLEPNEKLFLYINQTFSPPPDQTVKNLYDCYGTDGKLVIHYCKTQAWG